MTNNVLIGAEDVSSTLDRVVGHSLSQMSSETQIVNDLDH